MKVYFRYRTDSGDEWLVFREEGGPEYTNETKSENGEEAVTKQKEVPVDIVLVALRPATRIVDSVKGQQLDKDKYHVVVSDRSGTFELMTEEIYGWDEALKVASLFRNTDSRKARRIWHTKKLKQINSRWSDCGGAEFV